MVDYFENLFNILVKFIKKMFCMRKNVKFTGEYQKIRIKNGIFSDDIIESI